MPARRIPGSYHADTYKAVRGAVTRAHERRAGITSLDTARRDRRAKNAGTLDDVRKLEDTVLRLVERDG